MSLVNKVCLVTGASRGIGRGIALALGSEGATVYITGRTLDKAFDKPGSLTVTAEEVSARGGQAIPVQCDHDKDDEIHLLFDRIQKEHGKIDLLVNNAFKGVKVISENARVPFWEQEMNSWDDVMGVGLRCHFLASQRAAKLMIPQKQGLIVNISSPGALFNFFTIPYGIGKAGVDKMSEMCGKALNKHGVTCVSLWPGLAQTEHIMANKESIEKAKVNISDMDVSKGETVEYAGRAIVALMNDKNLKQKNGKTMLTGDLGREFGFTDVDGRVHPSMRSLKELVGMKHPWLAAFIPSFIRIPWSWIVMAVHHFY